MYKVPAKYFRGSSRSAPIGMSASVQVAGTIVRGTNKIDPDKLQLAIKALSDWEGKRAIEMDAERRSAVIALLYDYLVLHEDEGADAMDRVLRAL